MDPRCLSSSPVSDISQFEPKYRLISFAREIETEHVIATRITSGYESDGGGQTENIYAKETRVYTCLAPFDTPLRDAIQEWKKRHGWSAFQVIAVSTLTEEEADAVDADEDLSVPVYSWRNMRTPSFWK